MFVLIIANLSIIFNDGYKNRVPEILQKVSLKDPWNLLRNFKNQICYNNKSLCEFNTSSDKKIYLVGDSHAASIMYDIKDRIIKKKYQFITSTFSGCLYFPSFNLVNTKTNKIACSKQFNNYHLSMFSFSRNKKNKKYVRGN